MAAYGHARANAEYEISKLSAARVVHNAKARRVIANRRPEHAVDAVHDDEVTTMSVSAAKRESIGI